METIRNWSLIIRLHYHGIEFHLFQYITNSINKENTITCFRLARCQSRTTRRSSARPRHRRDPSHLLSHRLPCRATPRIASRPHATDLTLPVAFHPFLVPQAAAVGTVTVTRRFPSHRPTSSVTLRPRLRFDLLPISRRFLQTEMAFSGPGFPDISIPLTTIRPCSTAQSHRLAYRTVIVSSFFFYTYTL